MASDRVVTAGAAPRPRSRSWVPRRRLEKALDQIPAGGAGLVVAPAGSGKTVAMSQWSERHEPGPSWLTLTPAHNDAVVLARTLLSALHGAHAGLDLSTGSLVNRDGASLGATFVDSLVEELAALPTDVLLVLDDAHNLSGAPVVEDLERLLLALPGNVRVLVGSRWDPGFATAQLHLTMPAELRADTLAFDEIEARELVQSVSGRDITESQIAALVGRTEGWAVGLQLAAIAMRNVPTVDGFVDSFTGDDRLVADYLTDEVLGNEEEETRRFLLHTSILEWVTPELCDAVTGTDNANAVLDDLERRSVFVTPMGTGHLDRRRYHHLFAELLRYRLRLVDPDLETMLRGRAADWLEAHDELPAAIDQRLAAGDWTAAFDVIRTRGHRVFEAGQAATLVRWLETIETELPDVAAVKINLLSAQMAADRFTDAKDTYQRLERLDDL